MVPGIRSVIGEKRYLRALRSAVCSSGMAVNLALAFGVGIIVSPVHERKASPEILALLGRF
jgi:hypothetical protein